MNQDFLDQYLKLRLLVGFLGESPQHGWWQTSFVGQTATSFLSHVYPRTILLAQYHGVTKAAQLVHDEHIGVGHVFHLFRLTEEMEEDLHDALQKGKMTFSSDIMTSKEAALEELSRIGEVIASVSEGPVKVGSSIDILTAPAISALATNYATAFTRGVKTFPYFVLA